MSIDGEFKDLIEKEKMEADAEVLKKWSDATGLDSWDFNDFKPLKEVDNYVGIFHYSEREGKWLRYI